MGAMRLSLQIPLYAVALPNGRQPTLVNCGARPSPTITPRGTCVCQRAGPSRLNHRVGLHHCRAEGSGKGTADEEGESTRELALGDVVDVLQQQGIQFVFDEDEEEDDWDDILEDLDDPWMREPSPALEIDGATSAFPMASAKPAESPVSAYSPEAGFVEISVEELRAVLESPDSQRPILLDVRSTVEISARHIDGSVHVPLQSLTREAMEGYATATPVVVVGSGDHRSQQAAVRLKKVFGFEDVRHFTGGMKDWEG